MVMTNKGNKPLRAYLILLFISRQPKQSYDDKNRLWLSVDKTQGQKIDGTALTIDYDDKRERLTITNNGQKVFSKKASYGYAFQIKNPKNPRISKLRYPRQIKNIVPWFCGYSAEQRTDNKKALRKMRQDNRTIYGMDASNPDDTHSGRHHIFYYATKNGIRCPIAAYASNRMSLQEIRNTLKACAMPGFPKDFIDFVLEHQGANQPAGDYLSVN